MSPLGGEITAATCPLFVAATFAGLAVGYSAYFAGACRRVACRAPLR
jgi:hypothetical protein